MKKTSKKNKFLKLLAIILVSILIGRYSVKIEEIYKSHFSNKETNITPSKSIAMYIEDDEGNFQPSTSKTFPTEGYELDLEKSSCTSGGVLSQNPDTKKINLVVNKADKCNLYFKKEQTPEGKILAKLGKTSKSIEGLDFALQATTDETADGLYAMEDDYGTSYFYRGDVTDNYVKFADIYWRIIRVNGDGSVRLLYDGTSAHTNSDTSADRYIMKGQKFNTNSNDAKYVGYMYAPTGTTASTSKGQAQTNTSSSNVKNQLESWYITNIKNKNLDEYVADNIFCYDRSFEERNTGTGYGTSTTFYGARGRIGISSGPVAPQFTCPNKNDAFTKSDTKKGNGAMAEKVGLITADEAVAGGTGKSNLSANTSNYLHKNTWYWSGSPSTSSSNGAAISMVGFGYLNSNYANTTYGAIAPVINLTPEYFSTLIGDGSASSPFRPQE